MSTWYNSLIHKKVVFDNEDQDMEAHLGQEVPSQVEYSAF